VKIYSIHYNKPEYIKIQNDTIKKYVNFDYEFIIVNNAYDSEIRTKINQSSELLDLRTIQCNNSIKGLSSISHQNSFKYIIDDFKNGDDVMIIDHDLFLMDYLNTSYYEKYDMTILPLNPWQNGIRGSVEYPWPGLIIFNKVKNKEQISFNSGSIENQPCDTGGHLYYYIKNNNLNIKRISESSLETDELLMSSLDNIFLHLISGSGWNKNYDLESKINLMLKKLNING
jgi:hypothetical protein